MSGGIKFKRGNKVNFLGSNPALHPPGAPILRPYSNTYIWATLTHRRFHYIIQHPDGFTKDHFNLNNLKDGLKYIYAEQVELELADDKLLQKSNP